VTFDAVPHHSTGTPSTFQSVTVITDEGILADAAATALVVAGLEGWPAVAHVLGLDQVAVVDENGTVYMTPEMEKRLQFIGDVEHVIVEIPAMGSPISRLRSSGTKQP